MTTGFPLLRSLDPYHQRLGYLNCVALVAGRDLDRRDVLGARFQELIFERIYQHDPVWAVWYSRASKSGQAQIDAAAASAASNDPSAILLKNYKEDGWVHVQDLWVNDASMPSNVGLLSFDGVSSEEAKLYRPIELAKWVDLLLPTYELSENGVVLRFFLDEERTRLASRFNPLLVHGFRAAQLLYTRMFLQAECLFPTLMQQLVQSADQGQLYTSGPSGLLLQAVAKVLDRIGEPNDPGDMLELQGLFEFRDSLQKSNKTQENYLRPRMEILVELGLVPRQPRTDGFVWAPDDVTRRCALEWSRLAAGEETLETYLDQRYFSSMAHIFGTAAATEGDRNQILREVAIAYAQVGREFGFTPARTVALVACVNSWLKGRTMEIADVFSAIEETAKIPLGKHLLLSGGSRFDKEFLIRVAPGFIESLPPK